jgi:hypothetical protein
MPFFDMKINSSNRRIFNLSRAVFMENHVPYEIIEHRRPHGIFSEIVAMNVPRRIRNSLNAQTKSMLLKELETMTVEDFLNTRLLVDLPHTSSTLFRLAMRVLLDDKLKGETKVAQVQSGARLLNFLNGLVVDALKPNLREKE